MSGSLGVIPDARLVAVRQVRTDGGTAVYFALRSLTGGEYIDGAAGLSARYWQPGKAYAEADANPATPVQVGTGLWLVPLPYGGAGSVTVQMRIETPIRQTVESVFDPADLAPPALRRSTAELDAARGAAAVAGSDAAAALVKDALTTIGNVAAGAAIPVASFADLPAVGEDRQLYTVLSQQRDYRWYAARPVEGTPGYVDEGPTKSALAGELAGLDARVTSIPLSLKQVPGYILALEDMLSNIAGGLSDDWREWSIVGLITSLQANNAVHLKPYDGGGQVELNPGGEAVVRGANGAWISARADGAVATPFSVQKPLLSARVMARLTGLNDEPLIDFLAAGGTVTAGWEIRAIEGGGELVDPMGRVVLRASAAGIEYLGVSDQIVSLNTRVQTLEQSGVSVEVSQPVARIASDAVPVATRLDAGQASLSPGTYTEATNFKRVVFPRGARSIQALCLNQAIRVGVGEITPTDAYTTALSLEYAGAIYPLYFDGGTREKRLAPGKFAYTDPLPLYIPAGGAAIIRDYRRCETLGQVWPTAGTVSAVTAIGEGIFAGGNYLDTPTGSLPAPSVAALAQPGAIVGVPITAGRTVLIDGSSSFQGTGDKTLPDGPAYTAGYASRALGELGVPYIRQSASGSTAAAFLASNLYRRNCAILTGVSTLILGLGSNDFGGSTTLSDMQARINGMLDYARGLGKDAILYTYTPRNTSTDGWLTLAGQSVDANQTVRAATNAWLLTLTHPALLGVVDVAAILEEPTAPGKWRVDLGAMTADGTHPTPLGHGTAAAGTKSRLTTLLAL
jgi:hypothetical protein